MAMVDEVVVSLILMASTKAKLIEDLERFFSSNWSMSPILILTIHVKTPQAFDEVRLYELRSTTANTAHPTKVDSKTA